jgi:putative endopeptidase
MSKFLLSTLALAAALASGGSAQAQTRSGVDQSGFDPAVRVQDDLFRAVNGQWLNKTEIPADKPRYGTFIQLRDKSDREVRAIVERLAGQQHKGGSVEQKIGDYYKTYTDLAALDALGVKPVQPLLAEVDALKTPRDLSRYMGRQQGLMNVPVNLGVEPDFKKPTHYKPLTWQGGIGVPDRDYYLKTEDERYAKAVAAYRVYLVTLGRLAGLSDPDKAADDTLAIERKLAEAQWDKVELRNPVKLYNPRTLAETAKEAPGMDWAAFFEGAGLKGSQNLSLSQPSAQAGAAKLLAELPIQQWRHYFKLHLLDTHADTLPKAFRDARFAYQGTALKGTTEEKPRWQQGIDQVNGALGEALGRVYVAEHFPPEAKQRMVSLVKNLLGSFGDSLDGLAWMSPETKAKRQEEALHLPDQDRLPREVARLRPPAGGGRRRGTATACAPRVSSGHARPRAAGKPVDKTEWGMTPQTVNAYYNPIRQRDRVPGRHPAAALLRPAGRRRGQLRRLSAA